MHHSSRGDNRWAALQVDEDLEDKPITYYPEGDDAPGTNAETALDSSNKGFQLLQKMGWKGGKGLGKKEDGEQPPHAGWAGTVQAAHNNTISN